MPNGDITLTAEGYIQVSGELSFATVVSMRYRGVELLKKCQEAVFDLQGVTNLDSSALALLTAWTREANKMGKTARFIHMPKQLMDIAQLSNLQNVLVME